MGRVGICLALCFAVLFSPMILAADAVRTEVVSDTGEVIVVQFEIGEFLSETVVIDGEEYQ